MSTSDASRVEHWTTVAVTALPAGWRNVYATDRQWIISPCPAMLLQELVETTRISDDGTSSTISRYPAPRDTRTVFADYGTGELAPASDAQNYAGALAPGETTDSWTLPGDDR